jgi:hypothetical protein
MNTATLFRVAGVPNAYAQAVVTEAVLRPLYPGVPAAPYGAEVVAFVARLIYKWGRRVSTLGAARRRLVAGGPSPPAWKPDVWQDARCPCRPSAVVLTSRTPPCSPADPLSLCPHCWGRGAVAMWRHLDQTLFSRPGEKPIGLDDRTLPDRDLRDHALVTRTIVTPVRRGARANDVLRRAPDVRTSRREYDSPRADIGWGGRWLEHLRLRRACALGGHEVLTVAVRRPDDGSMRPAWVGYDATMAQLLVVPGDRLDDFLASPIVQTVPVECPPTVHVHYDPDRRALPRLVASLYAYPPSLLRGDADSVLDYLEARRGNPMVAGFGTPKMKQS